MCDIIRNRIILPIPRFSLRQSGTLVSWCLRFCALRAQNRKPIISSTMLPQAESSCDAGGRMSPVCQKDHIMGKVYNFNAGPAILPQPVLEQAQQELLDYQGRGMSIVEMSHRSKEYEAI